MTSPSRSRLAEAGRGAWALVGLALVAAGGFLLLRQVSVVVIALLLALFPAALLAPAAGWLRHHGLPGTMAALLLVGGLLGGLALTVRLLVPVVAEEVPAFVDAAERGLERVEDLLADGSLPFGVDSVDDAVDRGVDAATEGGDLAGRGLNVAVSVVHFGTGLTILVIALFFYLRDGRRLWSAVTDLVPERHEQAVQEVGGRIWWTLGAYLRGQLLVALFDAVFIGLGLLLLGVPLALPLAVVVFLGGLFPIVGAFVSGLLAVLVAFADAGLGSAALTLGLVVLVQQVESNLLEPLILSRVIALHPLVVVVAITMGALSFGVLGAFLAVPLAASAARAVDYLRGRTPEAGPGSPWQDTAHSR
jgi:predicted PurR-regulated permease PerM